MKPYSRTFLVPTTLVAILMSFASFANTLSADAAVQTDKAQFESSSTQNVSNAVAPVSERSSPLARKEMLKNDAELEDHCAKRHEEWKAEFSKFQSDIQGEQDRFLSRLNIMLVVIAIAVALVGVVYPLMTTQNWKKEIQNELQDLRDGKDEELKKLREDVVGSLHLCLAEYNLALDVSLSSPSIQTVPTLNVAMVLSSAVLCFDDLLEAAARTNNADILEREIKAFRPFLERWSNPTDPPAPKREEVWNSAKRLIEQCMRNKRRKMSGKDFARLLGKSSEDFLWLKKLYKDFAAWRFE